MSRGAVNIGKGSKVELYAVLACVPFATAAIIWAATIDSKANAALKDVSELKPVFLILIQETASLKTEIKNLREELKHQRK